MSNVSQTLGANATTSSSLALRGIQQVIWTNGLFAAAAWAAAALITVGLPDVVPWGSAELFAAITAGGATVLVALAFLVHRLGHLGAGLVHYGPWLIVIGVWLAVWLSAAIILALWELLRAALLAPKTASGPVLLSRYARVVYASALGFTSIIMTILLNQPAPDIVYKAF